MAESGYSSSGATDAIQIHTSRPEKIQRHDISDEELDMLCEGKKDFVLEFLWVALGATIGALPSALSALVGYFSANGDRVLQVPDLIQIVVLFVGLSLTIVLTLVAVSRGSRAKSLQTQIRERSEGSKPNSEAIS